MSGDRYTLSHCWQSGCYMPVNASEWELRSSQTRKGQHLQPTSILYLHHHGLLCFHSAKRAHCVTVTLPATADHGVLHPWYNAHLQSRHYSSEYLDYHDGCSCFMETAGSAARNPDSSTCISAVTQMLTDKCKMTDLQQSSFSLN